MKKISSFLLLLVFSSQVYAAQDLGKSRNKRMNFVEKRQLKARENKEDNFETQKKNKEERPQDSDFGFHEKKKSDKTSI